MRQSFFVGNKPSVPVGNGFKPMEKAFGLLVRSANVVARWLKLCTAKIWCHLPQPLRSVTIFHRWTESYGAESVSLHAKHKGWLEISRKETKERKKAITPMPLQGTSQATKGEPWYQTTAVQTCYSVALLHRQQEESPTKNGYVYFNHLYVSRN